MSLLFNMLSRLVIAFLPRSKHLLISWLQSPSAVILETRKIKSVTVSIVSPSVCHEVMGPDTMILVFWMLSLWGQLVMLDVRIPEWKERRLPRQCNSHKREVYCWLESGLLPHVQRSGMGSESAESKLLPNLEGVHKQLVAGLSGLVTCLQSNLIGPNLCGLFSNLGVRGLFQISPDRFPFSY